MESKTSKRITWVASVIVAATGLLAVILPFKEGLTTTCMEFDACAHLVCPSLNGSWERVDNSDQSPVFQQTKCSFKGTMDTHFDGKVAYSHAYDGSWVKDRYIVKMKRITKREDGSNANRPGCTVDIKQSFFPSSEKDGPKTYIAFTDDAPPGCDQGPASDYTSKFKKK